MFGFGVEMQRGVAGTEHNGAAGHEFVGHEIVGLCGWIFM
jgi:hypothetical protein